MNGVQFCNEGGTFRVSTTGCHEIEVCSKHGMIRLISIDCPHAESLSAAMAKQLDCPRYRIPA